VVYVEFLMQMLHQNMDHLYNNHIKQHDEQHAKYINIFKLFYKLFLQRKVYPIQLMDNNQLNQFQYQQ
jgi:hypothetical protein